MPTKNPSIPMQLAIPVLNAAAFVGFTGWIGYALARKILSGIWER